MQCPVCKTVQLNMTDRQGIEIDYCPNCRGVWLDRGELDKIIERSAGAAGAAATPPARPAAVQPPPPYATSHGHPSDPRHYHKKRRGGFLEDLFDFD